VFSIGTLSLNGFYRLRSIQLWRSASLTTCTILPAQVSFGGTLELVSSHGSHQDVRANALLLRPGHEKGLNAAALGAGLFAVGIVLVRFQFA